MNSDILIAVYGIIQSALREEGLLGDYAQPLKAKAADDLDIIALYKWLSEFFKGVSEKSLNQRKEKFNEIVRSLEKEYYLNNLLLALFLFEDLVSTTATRPQQIILQPKLNRLIKYIRQEIIKDMGFEVVKDSKIAASNIRRRFEGLPELTKKMREDKWQKRKSTT